MIINQHLVCAMENCDYSGLTDDEIKLIKDFPNYIVIDWEVNFKRCQLTGLYGDCVEIDLK